MPLATVSLADIAARGAVPPDVAATILAAVADSVGSEGGGPSLEPRSVHIGPDGMVTFDKVGPITGRESVAVAHLCALLVIGHPPDANPTEWLDAMRAIERTWSGSTRIADVSSELLNGSTDWHGLAARLRAAGANDQAMRAWVGRIAGALAPKPAQGADLEAWTGTFPRGIVADAIAKETAAKVPVTARSGEIGIPTPAPKTRAEVPADVREDPFVGLPMGVPTPVPTAAPPAQAGPGVVFWVAFAALAMVALVLAGWLLVT
jgi:hypothetical protein